MSDNVRRHDAIQGEILHEYDGIEEADNELPLWWVVGFLGTIAIGLGYWLGYEVFAARPTPYQEYLAASQAIADARAAELAAAPTATTELLEQLAADGSIVAAGKAAYTAQCVPCHGEVGEGKIGPNLTDSAWIHGGNALAIHRTIAEGVLTKGMPAWGPVLGPKAVREVTAYVLTLRNTNAAGGKPPEGEPDPDGKRM